MSVREAGLRRGRGWTQSHQIRGLSQSSELGAWSSELGAWLDTGCLQEQEV